MQRYFYNGWTHGHYVSNLFVFEPDGTIVKMVTNAPGCLHDSTIASLGYVYETLEDINREFNVMTVVDSAFEVTNYDCLIQSGQTLPADLDGDLLTVAREATSLRQMEEWGMRGIQGSFPRLKDKIIFEERGERQIIIQLIARLYNFRSNTVGINQLKSVYMPNLEEISDVAFKKYYTE